MARICPREEKRLSGSIPDSFASWAPSVLEMGQNQLSGKLPHAFVPEKFARVDISVNRLSGTLPPLLLTPWVFLADRNKFSGPLPSWLPACQECGGYVFILALNNNKFTGSVATLKHVANLLLSNNLLEGALPSHTARPSILDLSGTGGRSRGLSGTLPSALCRASNLEIFAIANQEMEAAIPPFTSTFRVFGLHRNRFKALPLVALKRCDVLNVSVCDLVVAFASSRRCNLKRSDLGALKEKGQCD